jgi:uncharacterized repeat protein (TIGR02543 family)
MNTLLRSLFLLTVLALLPVLANAQSAGDFQSHKNGNWSDVNSWERHDGSGWIYPAPSAPTLTDGTIAILDGHTMNVDGPVSADQVVIQSGGLVVVLAGQTLTVADGTDSVDMVISGTLNNAGTVTATGRIAYESGGLYVHSVPAGGTTLPSATWRTGSTCRIDSSSGSSPTNLNTQTLYNLIWNAANMGANGGPNFNDGAIIYGDLTVSNSKNLQFRLTNMSAGLTKNIYIRGNVYVNGATALLTSTGSGADTAARAIINIDGNVVVTAGTWSLVNSSNVYGEWKIKGNISITGGTMQSGTSGSFLRRTVNFCSGGTQSITVAAPGTIGSAATTFKLTNNSVVQVNFPWTLMSGGAFRFEGGQFVTSSTNLITLPANFTIIGGSASSFVNGPMAHTVAATSPTTKFFPIGKGSSYRPVTMMVNQDAATATTYTAEMFNTTAPSRTLPYTLLSVSPVRYWTISKGSGANLSTTLGASVQIAYDTDDGVTDSSMLRVAKDDGAGNWLNLGGSGTANTTGSITSNTFYSFSDFVLATADTSAHAVLATLTTTTISRISTTFATGGGNITNDGGGAVTARGVCWNTGGSPTTTDPHTTDGTGVGLFGSSLTGLTPGATYHVRAYAVNPAGTAYGDEVTFQALASLLPPTVTTSAISSIQVTSAVSGGNVTEWGGDSVTVRGVCWNTSGSPVVSDPHTSDGAGLGTYVSGLYPLSGNTVYHVRAYATNAAGTGYGNEITFTTQIPQPDTTVVVAQDGSGNYLTVQAAFNAVPLNYTGKWTIFVKNGTYYEKLLLASGKINVVLQGESRTGTILTYDDYADRNGPGNPGTSGSYSVAIDASDFTARDITFRNTYFPQPGVTGTQAVALRTQGDRHEYINCDILGYQDTYYTWGGNGTGRMYHRNCLIEGTVDFIFGRNIVVFDSCTIRSIRNAGTLTAASTDASSQFGYVFRNCTIVADSLGYDGVPNTAFYLGRPWQSSPRTVFINTNEPANLSPAGWLSWNVTPALYAEANCYGAGSATGGRVGWSSQLSGPTAGTYSLSNIFARNSASSNLILYDWMPVNAMSDPALLYRILSGAGDHGSILPSGTTNVAYGSSAGFTLVPDPGYHVADVLVDGVSIGAATSHTFTGVVANHTISVSFALNTYTLDITAVNGTVARDPDLPSYNHGTVVHLTATPSPGYLFTGWTGHVTGLTNPVDLLMDSDKAVTAHFELEQIAVTVQSNPEGLGITVDGVSYSAPRVFSWTPGTTHTIATSSPQSGSAGVRYLFDNWSDAGALNHNVTPLTGTTYTATFLTQYNLMLTADAGGSAAADPVSPDGYYNSGAAVQISATADAGHTFAGWRGAGTGSYTGDDNPASITMNGPVFDTAGFSVNQYSLTLLALHGSIAKNPDLPMYDFGSTVQLTALPDPGYHFIQWTGDATGSSNPLDVVIDSNESITAIFAINTFDLVTTAVHGSITRNPDQASYDSNSVVQLTAVPDAGYHFVDWTGDATGSTNPIDVTMDGNKSITANFAINQYGLNVAVVGTGTVAKVPDQPLYDHGTGVQLTATAGTGYLFSAWSGDATGSTNPLTVTIDAAKNITATFTVDPVYLTKFRTASMVDWATAADAKGKPNLVKCKPDKVEFRFSVVAPATATGVKVKLGMVSTGTVTRSATQIAAWSAAKEVSVTGIAAGDTLVVYGWGTKGKAIKAQLEWATTPKVTKVKLATYELNQPRLPLPNLVNVLSELGSWPLIGQPSSLTYLVTHPKYKDVQKSLNKKGVMHTGTARSLATFENGKPIAKPQKALPPDKHNNKLFAEVLAFGLNLGASSTGNFPPGLGALIYDDPADSEYGHFLNPRALDDIYYLANQLLGIQGTGYVDTNEYVYNTVKRINGAFRDGTIDTASWSCAGVKLTGVKALVDVPFLHAPDGFAVPKVEPVAVVEATPTDFALNQNYPNPFNPTTVIGYSLPVGGYVTLKVYNMLGQEIATLLDNVSMDEGEDEVEFDASNQPSGVYFYRLTVNAVDEDGVVLGQAFAKIEKMMLVK